MTESQFREEARDAARKAVLAAAKQARRDLSGEGVEYCRSWERMPSFAVTVRNVGREDYRDVHVTVTDSAQLFKGLDFSLPLIRKGESLTVPVVLIDRSRMNLRVRERTQLPSYDEANAVGQWWQEAEKTRTEFFIATPGGYDCIDGSRGSTCIARPPEVRLKSGKKVWVTEGYRYKRRA